MSTYNDQAQCVYDFINVLSDEQPEIAKGFKTMHKASGANTVLTAKVKELVALGIAIAIRCEGCIACHIKAALNAGASHEEITETIGVSVVMGGGPSIVYGEKAYKAMKEMMALAEP